MEINQKPTSQSVIITGASTGIGQACALYLDNLGFRVFAGVRRDEDGFRLKARASKQLSTIFIDVTDVSSIASAAKAVEKTLNGQGLGGLVNNAGIVVAAPLEFLPLDKLRWQFEVNVVGQIAVTQAFMPLLRRGGGRVVNIGSIGGRMATPFMGPYAASKFAMEALTDALRIELQPWDIPVSIIEPGSIATPIWEKSTAAGQELRGELPSQAEVLYGAATDAIVEAADRSGRAGIPPQAVAEVVAHALTASRPKTRYIVGQDAMMQAVIAKAVPDRLRDKLITRALGLPGRRNRAPSSITPKVLAGLGLALVIGVLLSGKKGR